MSTFINASDCANYIGVFGGKLTEQQEGTVKLNDIGFYHQYYKMKMGKKLKSEV